MSYETRSRWTGKGNSMCPLERRARFGPVQPMQQPSWLDRLLEKVRK